MLIAHKSSPEEITYREQSLTEHLENVSKLCGVYADKIGLKSCGEFIGYLHDIGKATDEFQNYINGESSAKKGPDHSTAGAIFTVEIAKNFEKNSTVKLTSEIISLVIMSHHGGLSDIFNELGKSPFLERLTKTNDENYSINYNETISKLPQFFDADYAKNLFQKAIAEMDIFLSHLKEKSCNKNYNIALICRFLYSALIDADRYDSACFCDNIVPKFTEHAENFSYLSEKYEDEISKFTANTDINKLRQILSDNCYKSSFRPTGIYTLNCPTGSGKTLSSFRFALNHAAKNNKTRIFYVAPFLTILKQNVQAISDKIGDKKDVILEVHSAKEPNEKSDETTLKQDELLSQRLDSPIVFISMVRFLNIFFGAGSKNARPLHNFADSIIIFDEVQTISPKQIAIFSGALSFLRNFCNSTVVLSTATQPTLNNELSSDFPPLELEENHEISNCSTEIIEKFRRTEIIDKTELKTEDSITNFILELTEKNDSVLIILNTKSAVRKVYDKLKSDFSSEIFVLTTNLYPIHREQKLDKIRSKLGKEKLIVISTQLIEAGVDISFSCVVRSLAGLDSVIQAAGRCNRHGEFKDSLGQIYLVKPDFENLDKLQEINTGKDVLEEILVSQKLESNPKNSLDSESTIEKFFVKYYLRHKKSLKYPFGNDTIYDILSDNKKLKSEAISNLGLSKKCVKLTQSFKYAEHNFEAIESLGKSVIVAHNESVELIEKLKSTYNFTEKNSILKKLQRYTVNLFLTDKTNGIYPLEEHGIFVLREGYYDETFGVSNEIIQKNFNF